MSSEENPFDMKTEAVNKSENNGVVSSDPDPESADRSNATETQKAEGSHLSENQEADVREFSRAFLQDFDIHMEQWESQQTEEELDLLANPVSAKIAEITGVEEKYKTGISSFQHEEGTKIFFDELIEYAKTQKDENKINTILFDLDERMFSHSDNIFSEMNLEDQFFTSAKANRVLEVRGWLGSRVNNDFVQELNYAPDESLNSISKRIDSLDATEKIDVLKHCQTIAAIAAGNSDWAERAFSKIKRIAEHLVGDPSALVSLTSSMAVESMDQELEDPQHGFIGYSGDEKRGRLRRVNGAMHMQTFRILSSFGVSGDTDVSDLILAPIASDAVGVFNKSLDIEGVSMVKQDQLNNIAHEAQVYNNSTENEQKVLLDDAVEQYDLSFQYGENQKNNDGKSPRPSIFLKSLDNTKAFEDEWQYLNDNSPEEKELFLRAIYDPLLREKIADDLDIEWTSVPLASQVHFLEYLVSVDRGRYEKLTETIQKYGGNKEKLLETFLATQYGEDYGDIITEIADSEYEHKHELLEEYVHLNDLAKKTGDILGEERFAGAIDVSQNVQEKLPCQMAEAIMRRGKDVLNVASIMLESDKSTDVPFYWGKKISVMSPDEVIESLHVYTDALKSVHMLLNYDQNNEEPAITLSSTDHTADIDTYHFKMQKADGADKYVSLQLRSRGALKGEHDRDREFNGDARINFLFNNESMKTDLSDKARQDALSLRIDREGRIPKGKDGKKFRTDPTKQDGELSLEMGGVLNEDKTLPNSVVGRVIAVGNWLGLNREDKLDQEIPQYYHNRESFSKELGDADVFADIVRKIRTAIEDRFVVPIKPSSE
ncbi:MAG: hypothetical protein KAS07_00790 [Candidatus Pacebacteria bacterium]|nr:hypothetical protein [Candidatus Paceibacterota bacterium]